MLFFFSTQRAFDVPLQTGAFLLHPHPQVAPQVELVHGAAQAFHGLLIFFREAAVGEGEEILRQPGLVIECDRGETVCQTRKEVRQFATHERKIQLVQLGGRLHTDLGADFLGAQPRHAAD